MNDETLRAFALWGDRTARDTAHLLDLAVAGTIDQTIGHGTVTLRPARLEELAARIAKRETDPDGGWKVTLNPATDEPVHRGIETGQGALKVARGYASRHHNTLLEVRQLLKRGKKAEAIEMLDAYLGVDN